MDTVRETKERVRQSPRLALQLEHIDGNTIITLPQELGGGSIVEPDYHLSFGQITILTQLNFAPTSTTIDIDQERKALSRSPIDALGYRDRTRTAELWQQKDILRIMKPLAEYIFSKNELGHDLNESENDFYSHFEIVSQKIDSDIAQWEGTDEQQHEAGVIQAIVANHTEFERRKRKGLLYADGTSCDTYTARAITRRRHLVLNGTIFTSEYLDSRIGRLTMQFLRGSSPGNVDEEWQGVAAADARLVGRGILTEKELHALDDATRRVFSPQSYHAVLEGRQMNPSTAHARQTTGDGRPVLSRPGPGQ